MNSWCLRTLLFKRRCRKRRRVEKGNSEIDRLSSLPDSLLIRSLSFLDLKEAVKTAVLSKQWRFLWTDLPRLELEETSRETDQILKFVAFVNRIIADGRRAALNYFHVEFCYDKRFASDVDAWVEFAVTNKVENLSLLLDTIDSGELYRLSQAMCSSSSLTCLSLDSCFVVAPVEWRCLTELSLCEVKMSQQQLENVVSGCPVLESLELDECWGFHRLAVGNPSFRRLCVVHCSPWSERGGRRRHLLEISAAYMRELDVSMISRDMKLRVTDAPALEQATIGIFVSDYDSSSVEMMSDSHKLFQDISHVNKLNLGCHTAQVLSMLATNGWELPQFRLQNLVVYVVHNLHNISGIIALIKSSPKLKKLVILDGYKSNNEKESINGVQIEDELDCDLLHLASVDIAYFGETTLTLAQILLERAPALVEMVIRNTSSSSTVSDNFINKFEALLVYPKYSQKAKVVIHQ